MSARDFERPVSQANMPNRRRMTRCGASQKGISLVEIMVAMTVGLVVLFAVVSVYVGSRQTFRSQEDNARLQETGRYALEMIGRSVRLSGWSNVSTLASVSPFSGDAIGGEDGAGPAPDTLQLQFDALAGQAECGIPLAADALATETYSLDGNALQCNGQALVSDIEDLQVLYGIDTDNDQTVNRFVKASALAGPGDWNQVRAVRVCILAFSENLVTNTSQSYLNCDGALGVASGSDAFTAAGDRRLRRAFVATYGLRNRLTSIPAP